MKILVIDDISVNIDAIRSILNVYMPEYEIITALSGMAGIDLAQSELPEVVLLDYLMPKMNGFEVCEKLKQSERTKNIPILMVSALGDNSKVRTQGFDAGADAFISKPFDIREFVSLVKVMLRIKKAEDQLRQRNEELEQYQQKLKKLNRELTQAEEKERKRIAEYLHDGIGQTLALAFMNLSSVPQNEASDKIKKTIKNTARLINNAISETRLLTYDLSPPILYELGLQSAIKWKLEQVQNKFNINTTYNDKGINLHFNAETSISLYRIVCELITNVIKHAKATLISVEINTTNEEIQISVVDDGIGYTGPLPEKYEENNAFGIFSIIERLDALNGSLKTNSVNGEGTTMTVHVPQAVNI